MLGCTRCPFDPLSLELLVFVIPASLSSKACLLCRFLLPDPVPWWQQPLLQAASVFLKSPEQGAQTSIYLAISPEVEGISSKYYSDCKPKTSSSASYDAEVAKRLWDISQEMTDAPADSRQGSSLSQTSAGTVL